MEFGRIALWALLQFSLLARRVFIGLYNPHGFRLSGHSPCVVRFCLADGIAWAGASGLFTTGDIAYLVYFLVELHVAAIAFRALRGCNPVVLVVAGDATVREDGLAPRTPADC